MKWLTQLFAEQPFVGSNPIRASKKVRTSGTQQDIQGFDRVLPKLRSVYMKVTKEDSLVLEALAKCTRRGHKNFYYSVVRTRLGFVQISELMRIIDDSV